jgi:hypothetical protein
MKVLLLFILTFLSFRISSQELDDFEKKINETNEEYISRVKQQNETLTYELVESYEWDSKNPSIISFYQIPRDSENVSEIIGHIYMKQYDVNYYRDIVFGNFIGESEYPEIIDVFWLNIDDDTEQEMFVLFKYFTRHYDFTGYIYDLAVLDNPNIYYDCLDSIDIFSNLFITFEGISGDGIETISVYTTKEDIIRKIHELGY